MKIDLPQFLEGFDIRNNVTTIIENETLIPVMTSNTAPSGVASASENNSIAWRSFKILGSPWYSDSVGTQWLQYRFGVTPTFRKYKVHRLSQGGTPRDFTFQVSNDGSNWSTIDTQTNITNDLWIAGGG